MANLGWTSTEASGGGEIAPNETPAWMSQKQGDVEAQTTELSANSSADLNLTPIESSGKNMQPTDDDAPKRSRLCCGLMSIISLCFIGGLVFLAIHLGKSLYYTLFFAALAAVPGSFLLHYWVCFPVRVIYLYAIGMGVWATVVLVLQSIRLANAVAAKDESTIEDAGWYVAGCSLGIISCMYHICVTRGTIKKKSGDNQPEYGFGVD